MFLLPLIFLAATFWANSTEKPASLATGWQYEKTGPTASKATLSSENLPEFPYPFAGGSVVTLGIRKKDEDTYVYLEVSKGLFTRSFQSGRAQVQFDTQSPVAYTLTAAANGRANIVFFNSEQKLINQIKGSKIMIVRTKFAGQPTIEVRYKTAGLRWAM